jgi:uncharacterized lipoprotein YmbA
MKFAGVLRAAGVGSALVALTVLSACSSPASRFYTLGGGDAVLKTSTPASFYLEVSSVDMPPQVARNQMVVQDGSAQVKVLEDERWASLPADEVRRALSADLTQRLGSIDVYGTPHPEGVPVYRVKVNVQQFVSSPGRRALIDAVWSVRGVNNEAVLTCRTLAEQPVDAGFDALVAGHKRAVDQLAADISAGVHTVSLVPMPVSASSAMSKPAAGKMLKSVPLTPAVLPCPMASVASSAASTQ